MKGTKKNDSAKDISNIISLISENPPSGKPQSVNSVDDQIRQMFDDLDDDISEGEISNHSDNEDDDLEPSDELASDDPNIDLRKCQRCAKPYTKEEYGIARNGQPYKNCESCREKQVISDSKRPQRQRNVCENPDLRKCIRCHNGHPEADYGLNKKGKPYRKCEECRDEQFTATEARRAKRFKNKDDDNCSLENDEAIDVLNHDNPEDDAIDDNPEDDIHEDAVIDDNPDNNDQIDHCKCTRCKKEYPEDDFGVNKENELYKLCQYCRGVKKLSPEQKKQLLREKNKRYRQTNLAKIREREKSYYYENQKKILDGKKGYYYDNYDDVRSKQQKYYDENSDAIIEHKRNSRLEKHAV